MQFFRWYLITVSLSLLSLTVPVPALAKISPALAVLSQLKGEVNAGPAKKCPGASTEKCCVTGTESEQKKNQEQQFFSTMVPNYVCLAQLK